MAKAADEAVVLTDKTLRWVGFVSGAAAGITRVMIGHPFDTLKVRLQTGRDLSIESSFRGFLSLYRGILPPTFSVAMSSSTNFGIYENTRLSLIEAWGSPSIHAHAGIEFVAGTVAGTVMGMALIPLENAKVLQQTSREQNSTIGWIRKLYQYRGIASLYRGVFAQFVQSGCGRGFYLSAYFIVKSIEDRKILKNWVPRDTLPSSDTVRGKIIAAAFAGIAGWSFTYPFDVVRSNMMRDWRVERHQSTIGCFRYLIGQGGISQLYAGFGFTILRAIPVACVALPSYDITRRTLLRILEARSKINMSK